MAQNGTEFVAGVDTYNGTTAYASYDTYKRCGGKELLNHPVRLLLGSHANDVVV